MSSTQQSLAIQDDLTVQDCQRLSTTGVAAIDVETTGLNPLRDLLCLVQISDLDHNITFVRAQNWLMASNLRSFFQDPDILKIFHFALFDCSFLAHHLNIEVANAYCTKIASKFARTYSSHHGLVTLAQELCGVTIDKNQQMTDWCGDDLSSLQLEYAINDVVYLFDIKEKLDTKLAHRGNLPSGLSYTALNDRCQAFLPTLVQLQLNLWGDVMNGEVPVFSR